MLRFQLKKRFEEQKTDFALESSFDDVFNSFEKKFKNISKNHIWSKDENIIWREATVLMPQYKEYCSSFYGKDFFIDRHIDFSTNKCEMKIHEYKLPISKYDLVFSKTKNFILKNLYNLSYLNNHYYNSQRHYVNLKNYFNNSPYKENILIDIKQCRYFYNDEDILQMVDEFLKFVSIIEANPYKNMGMLSQDVDLVWHICISYTEFYREMCEYSGRLITHAAGTKDTHEFDCKNYITMLTIYRKFFGKPNGHYWPIPVSEIKKIGKQWNDTGDYLAYLEKDNEDNSLNNKSLNSYLEHYLLNFSIK